MSKEKPTDFETQPLPHTQADPRIHTQEFTDAVQAVLTPAQEAPRSPDTLPHHMTREEFAQLVVFHGTSGANAQRIAESIHHPAVANLPKYKDKGYVGRVISTGQLGKACDFTYNPITAAKYAIAKSKLWNADPHASAPDIPVVLYTRRADIGLRQKGTYVDSSEVNLSESQAGNKATSGGIFGSIPASLFENLDQLNPDHVEAAIDLAYTYVQAQRQ